MKKFSFSLETVLSYKQQILDSLQAEHAECLRRVRVQEEHLENLWQKYHTYSGEYSIRCARGMTILEARTYQANLRARERGIQQETERLKVLRTQEEAKRAEVVEAKKETASIEKLKEKKLAAYHAAEAKSEERFVEEFVMSVRSNKGGPQADTAVI